MESSVENMLKKAKNADSVIIVGAGSRGKNLLTYLNEHLITVTAFFDNNTIKQTDNIQNIKIFQPYKIEYGTNLYIIAIENIKNQEDFLSQLLSLGISDDDILIYDYYERMSKLPEADYPKELDKRYYEVFGKKINWENPVTYNEKINCEKLNMHDEIRTRLVDKLLVKDWVREQIGEKYLTKLYAVWDDEAEIDFDTLPESFVLKMNNGSGRNIIVKDKSKINQNEVRKQLKIWKKQNYAYNSLELQYKDVVPKIICDEYLEGVAEDIYDYNIYCFHGEPEYIWCIKGSHRPGCKASFYNKKWEMQPFSYGYPKDEELAPKPEKLEEMLELSRILSKNFKHVRVDWYNLPDGRVLFGEMTFATWSGLQKFKPDEYDTILGNLI